MLLLIINNNIFFKSLLAQLGLQLDLVQTIYDLDLYSFYFTFSNLVSLESNVSDPQLWVTEKLCYLIICEI